MLENLPELALKIFLAFFLSGLIGSERKLRRKAAGLRTHVLVGVGSALIVLTSFHIFDIYKDQTTIDPTRMIHGIVTGVGFLCAGTIIRAGDHVYGLTTAATLWVVSGVGIAVGAGHYSAAIMVTVLVFLVLTVLRSWERALDKKIKNFSVKGK